MARATATWTDTETADWTTRARVRETKLKQQFLQNIEHLAQNHSHGGGTADGAPLATANPLVIWYYGAASGGPFA